MEALKSLMITAFCFYFAITSHTVLAVCGWGAATIVWTLLSGMEFLNNRKD